VRLGQAIALVLLLLDGAWGACLMLSADGLGRLQGLRLERARIDEESERLSAEIEQLRVRAQAIKGDPVEVERVARERLGLIRPTEVVVQFSR
jgi:cell division protein FtsB